MVRSVIGFRQVAVQSAVGGVAIALVTWLCFLLHLKLAAPLCLDLAIVVLLSLQGSFLTSALISIFAVAGLDYYFTEPLFSPLILDPVDGFAIALFFLTAAVITMLVSRLRTHGRQLALANANLEEQIAEVKYAQDQVNLARVNRVMLMGELTASIAHEVNQPLTGILGHAGTAQRYLTRDVPDMQAGLHYLDLVVRDSKRAGAVIAHIRALARKTPPQTQQVDINEAIHEVVSLTSRELQSSKVELRMELQNGLPQIQAARVQVQQVILNLIVNAIEAMHDLPDARRELLLNSGSIDAKAVFVEVRDSGPGLDTNPDEFFKSFYTTKPEGMGMGLSISRSIVEAHGGRLSAMPNEPRGAIFRFTLPVETA
jgi:C4-dicarboxylate-specific signal transduction histidine kinase